MLTVPQVARVRQVVSQSEQIVRKINQLLQRDGTDLSRLLDLRASRILRDLEDLDRLTLEMGRLAQEVLMVEFLGRQKGQVRAS